MIPLVILLSLLSAPPLVINMVGGLLSVEYDGLSTCCFIVRLFLQPCSDIKRMTKRKITVSV